MPTCSSGEGGVGRGMAWCGESEWAGGERSLTPTSTPTSALTLTPSHPHALTHSHTDLGDGEREETDRDDEEEALHKREVVVAWRHGSVAVA